MGCEKRHSNFSFLSKLEGRKCRIGEFRMELNARIISGEGGLVLHCRTAVSKVSTTADIEGHKEQIINYI